MSKSMILAMVLLLILTAATIFAWVVSEKVAVKLWDEVCRRKLSANSASSFLLSLLHISWHLLMIPIGDSSRDVGDSSRDVTRQKVTAHVTSRDKIIRYDKYTTGQEYVHHYKKKHVANRCLPNLTIEQVATKRIS